MRHQFLHDCQLLSCIVPDNFGISHDEQPEPEILLAIDIVKWVDMIFFCLYWFGKYNVFYVVGLNKSFCSFLTKVIVVLQTSFEVAEGYHTVLNVHSCTGRIIDDIGKQRMFFKGCC